MMRNRIFSALGALLLSFPAFALELPDQIGTNMMLQQQTQARLWGWAQKGSLVSITTSWNQKPYTALADKQTGRWEVLVDTPEASFQTYSITFAGDGETLVADNVLIGEVWFCSGQSNMEMPLAGFWNCPVEGANRAIAQSGRYKNRIRVATIPKVGAQEPQDRVAGCWKTSEPANAPAFSAIGYFFAQTLTDLLDVPVGIINCSWGGSCVEGWMPKEILLTYPDGLTPMDDTDYHAKMVMYNGMLYPLAGYTIKGFLWNQGESNVGKEQDYIERFQTMTQLWRKLWRQPNDPLPMYTCELPPFNYGDPQGEWGAKFRAAQHVIAHQLENSGCICTNDLIYPFEGEQVHGTKKQEMGERLAYMAATRNYGIQGIEAEAPEFQYMKQVEIQEKDQVVVAGTAVAANPNEKGKVTVLYFSNLRDGVDRLYDIEGFEAAGADGVWHRATVWADGDWKDTTYQGCYLKLVCPEAGEVKNVRYNFHNFAPGNLHNVRQLPVVPFQTNY